MIHWTPEVLRSEVDRVLAIATDDKDEAEAHMAEDCLHLAVIRQFCPSWVVAEVDRLTRSEHERWYS